MTSKSTHKVLIITMMVIVPLLFSFVLAATGGSSTFLFLSDEGESIVYDKQDHAAFTTIEEWHNSLYMAFRTATNHLPQSNDLGKIVLLKNSGNGWSQENVFEQEGVDLRDPFLIKWNGNLMLYTLGYYSILTENGWTALNRIKHNASYPLNIWKKRSYKNKLYGVGNAGGKWPVLLCSVDGINWDVITTYRIGGDASEADLCFIGDTLYTCVRIDTPVGSNSMWGKSPFPFTKTEWRLMDKSIASPEMIHLSDSVILLTGREYILHNADGKDSVNVSIFEVDKNGNIKNRYLIDKNENRDKGYPSFCVNNGLLYMSYYTGTYDKTLIKLHQFRIK